MLVRYFLFHLPIHRRPFAEYYRQHDKEVAERRPEIEKEWGAPWDELPPHIRIYWQDRFYWPPWFLNDAVGFLKVGSDGEEYLVADVFLERNCFPATAPEKFSRHGDPGDAQEIVYFSSIGKHPITRGDNGSYIAALEQILDEARRVVQHEAQGLPEAEIWLPGYDLSCFDLARADRQLRERFPERTKPR